MDTLYFLSCIGGIFWLALWSIRDPQRRSRFWWPFDMKDDDAASPPAPTPSGPPRSPRRNERPARRAAWTPRRRAT
ncbi:MAG: hypothetical protein LGL72_17690 [Acidibrevibacterium sp.]|jgi:hypothetical protein|uniref:hypothetical protein n=1 Tax=Acidibrevibacterium fodinaquatile TaxID=1969806 RepID=UPI0023A7C14E|nr:hypothetical protein [Acidibrevibacterium fodinaquatile]MCA7121179.1 hypothetical protein [Acidibrevibacterium fodinaquatile]